MKVRIRRKIILLITVAVMMLILLPMTALASVGSTQTLDSSWSSDTTNGFLEASTSATIEYDASYHNAMYVNSGSTSGQWIEFGASSAEGLFSFDLSSLTVNRGSSGGPMKFEVVGTTTGGSTVTENISWDLGTEVETFTFSKLTGITKFRVNMSDFVPWCADFVSFTISNQVNSGNAAPVISNLSDAAFRENTVNVAAQQLDADISVSDTDSADLSGGKVTVSYTGTGLTEDQLSVGNIGKISVSGTTVSYLGVGSIGTVSGGGSGSSLVITLGDNATPARTVDLLRAICYADASDEPTSYRTVSITVSDGDGATSNAVTAKISVTGEADNGSVETPGTDNDLKADWLNDLNNYFSIASNDTAWSLSGDASLIWLDDGPINVGTGPASLTISAAEQFDGGMFDLTKILFDLDASANGKTFTVTVTGHKAGGTQITGSTNISTTGSNAMNLSNMTGLTSFDVQVEGSVDLSFLSLDSFMIANPKVANIPPSVTGVTTPASGSTDVSVDTNIVIQFSESLDTATIGTVTLNGTSYTNGSNATISVSGSAVTVNPMHDFAYDTKYTGLSVSGFKDTGGGLMTAYTDSAYNFTTLQPIQLTTPTDLVWNGTIPGKATWNTVSNVTSYTVQLYKGGTAQGSSVTGVTATEYDFTAAIASEGSGAYTFKVTAVGDGTNYTSSAESAASAAYSYTAPVVPIQLTTPTGLVWNGTIPGKAMWNTVSNVTSYTVQLYKGGTAQGSPVTGVTATEYDFTAAIASEGSGAYTFKVTAVGDGSSYTNSAESAASAAYSYTAPVVPIQLTTPTGLVWNGTIPGKATWNTVSNVTSYTVQLYKGGTAQGSAVTGVAATEYDFTAAIASAGTGAYTFKVTAVGDGSSYTNSVESAASAVYSYTAPSSPIQLDTPTGLVWNGATPGKATWSAVSNAVSYTVQLYKGGTAQGSPYTGVAATEYDFTAAITSAGTGVYTFRVTAVGDGSSYTNSVESAASAVYSYTGGAASYIITASAGSGGSISPSGLVSVTSGGSLTFTITPDNNYGISSVTVDGVNRGTIASYTFSNVSGNHTISATFTYTGGNSGGSPSGGGNSAAKYTVSADTSPNGTVTLSTTNAKEGGSVTIAISPKKGYRIANVLINGVSVGAVSSYTIKGIGKNITVQAVFEKLEEDEAWVNPYSDVPDSAWYYACVSYISRKGLMNGDSRHFDPDGDMTRAMVVTVLFRLGGDSGSYKNTFSDVDSGTWYGQAVAWASANGIVSGVGGNRFAPESPLSREQLAVMLYNYAKYIGLDVTVTGSGVLDGYSDAGSVSAWAEDAINWAVSLGIISGDGVNLDPQGNATRAQIAAMLQRFTEYVDR